MRVASKRREIYEYIDKHKPMFVIGSPPCTFWSIIQNINTHRGDKGEWEEKAREARLYLDFLL